MKKHVKALVTGATAVALFAFAVSCKKDGSQSSVSSTLQAKTPTTLTQLASLGQSAFNLWGTCNGKPYNIASSNGICIPVGNCSSDIDAAQEASSQSATGLQFNGCFKGGSAASSGASEEAVFLCDNVSTWQGNEMGFVKTLNDNALKAYIQHGIGGGQVEYLTTVVLSNDNGYHTFKCQARSANHNMVDFYVDGNYKCTLTSTKGGSYYGNNFYFVGTNHWYGGGSNTGQQIEMYNMTTY